MYIVVFLSCMQIAHLIDEWEKVMTLSEDHSGNNDK